MDFNYSYFNVQVRWRTAAGRVKIDRVQVRDKSAAGAMTHAIRLLVPKKGASDIEAEITVA